MQLHIPDTMMQTLSQQHGTTASALSYLGGGQGGSDGIVYQYDADGKTWTLKFMILPTQDAGALDRVTARLKFVHYLGEHGVPLAYPLLTPGGDLLAQAVEEDRRYIAYRCAKAGGKPAAPETWSDGLFREWGRILGRAHRATQQYPIWQPALGMGWEDEWNGFYKWCKDDAVRDAWQALKAELDALPVERTGFGFIHNDPHCFNLLVDGEKLTLLDFDVALPHWFMTDIAAALYSALCGDAGGFERPQKTPGFGAHWLETFLNGYEQENHLDPFWLDRLETFLHYRRILLFIVFYEGLQKHPDYLNSWRERIVQRSPILTY